MKIMKIVDFSQNLNSDLLSKHFDLDSDLDLDLENEEDENDKINSSIITDKRVTFILNSSDIHISMLLISKKTSESNMKSYSESHSQSYSESHSESHLEFYSHSDRMPTSDPDPHAQLYIKLNTVESDESS